MHRRVAVHLLSIVTAALLLGCPEEDGDPGGDAATDAALDGAMTDVAPEPEPEPQPEPQPEPEPDVDPCRPSAERCNGADDDCDGTSDEGFAGLGDPCSAGQGACAVEGVIACTPDGRATVCDATARPAGVEACNDIDDDCDGITDEDFALGLGCERGIGACQVFGEIVCRDGGVACSVEAAAPGVERCDGIDDDCDGRTDERLDGAACETGEPGACNAGVLACDEGAPSCAPAVEPVDEGCDGIDNDCDGMTDEGGVCAEDCENGVDDDGDDAFDCADIDCAAHVACRPPEEICNDGDDDDGDDLADCADPDCVAHPFCRVELCDNGADDDGDGAVDCDDEDCAGRGFCVPEDCDNGADDDGDGAADCVDDDCAGDAACRVEDCANGVDDDGDGRVDCADGDCAVQPICRAEDCGNGADDDGDGAVDCDDVDCRGEPVCERRTVLVCGDPQRDLGALFTAADGVDLASGCDAAPTVRAILVSRGGVPSADWRAWVEGGGRLVTEYSNSDEIYAAIFGDAVVPGEQIGACADNVNPVVRQNTDDAFWQINRRLAPSPVESSGCGFDMARYPEITALGGWDAGNVSLAYRDLGDGRVWLVEGDWQDNEAGETYFTLETRALLRSMVLDPFDARCDAAGGCPGELVCLDGGCVRPASEDCRNGEDDDLDGLVDCDDATCVADGACLPACGGELRVAVMGGEFYHDELRAGLDQLDDVIAERIDACDAATLDRYDVVVLHGNAPCSDRDAFVAYVERGGGLVGVPWIASQGDADALPVEPGDGGQEGRGPAPLVIVDPSDPLVAGLDLSGRDGRCEDGEPPISGDPDCAGIARVVGVREGAHVAAAFDDGTPSAVWWRLGEGRAVYLGYHYVTSDTYSAMPHAWGRRLMENAVRLAAGCRAGAVREAVMLCGRADGDVAWLLPPGRLLALIEGCEPDARIQALLITRGAIDGGLAIDERLLRSYLEEGGIVITEYSVSDEIYGMVTGDAVEPGMVLGNCNDNIDPPARQNLDDPFWRRLGDLPPLRPELSGCGYDMSGYRGITPLGGWDERTVSLAYRDIGLGRLWLVESDWQDGQGELTETSRALMHSMILDRGPAARR